MGLGVGNTRKSDITLYNYMAVSYKHILWSRNPMLSYIFNSIPVSFIEKTFLSLCITLVAWLQIKWLYLCAPKPVPYFLPRWRCVCGGWDGDSRPAQGVPSIARRGVPGQSTAGAAPVRGLWIGEQASEPRYSGEQREATGEKKPGVPCWSQFRCPYFLS